MAQEREDGVPENPGGDLCQYLLTNPAAIRRLVDAAGIGPRDRVLEAGGGQGHITAEIVSRGPRSVETVELDPKLADALERRFATTSTVTVTRGDGFAAIKRARANVLVSSLPIALCDRTLGLALASPAIERCVLVANRTAGQLDLPAGWEAWDVEDVSGDDFTPFQPMVSHVVALRCR